MNKAAQKLGRIGGLKTSEAKAAAAKANGAKGGRPRKTPKADAPSEPANEAALHRPHEVGSVARAGSSAKRMGQTAATEEPPHSSAKRMNDLRQARAAQGVDDTAD